MKYIHTFLLLAIMVIASSTIAQSPAISTNQNGFTQADREKLIRIETILEQHEKRFESIDKRLEEQHSSFGWMISLFGIMTVAIVTLAFWDRRASL